MVSKTASIDTPDFKKAREKCEKMKDPEDRRKCLDDVLFDAVDAIGTDVQSVDARNADRVELMEGRLTNLIEKGFNKVDERFNKVDERFNKVDARLNVLENRTATVERNMVAWNEWLASKGNPAIAKIEHVEKLLEGWKKPPETMTS